jgi:NitT/TauT family transport system ATP-binding protein
MEMNLELKNINKSFADLEIFNDFSISFVRGSINCILGPSGCGKTTLLNIINGSVLPDSGIFDDFEGLILSCVFQEPRLLPWKSVKDNIAFVLKERMSNEEMQQRLDEYLSLVQLEKFSDYYPSKLSGGMKQRVSLARAFSYDSDVILMDEPFKALDYKLKYNLIEQFFRLWERDKRTVIFVTHDVDEALLIGHSMFLFSNPPVRITDQYLIPEDQNKKDQLRSVLLEKLNGV